MAGLLHDADWETTRETPERHTLELMDWLEEFDLEDDDSIKSAILAHNHFHNGHQPPQNTMEWSLYCCDELTGLIVASTLVLPDKKISSLTTESVINRFGESSFAKGVDRDQIRQCEDNLGIPLDEFITIVLESMQDISEELGL
jgi:predicted hydrolase (HD superfamily)